MPETYFSLSKKERELMELFWDAGAPLSRTEILERAAQRPSSWKPNSVHILVNSLLDKGALQVAGFYLNSRKLGRTFEPMISRAEFALMQVGHAVRRALEEGVTPAAVKKIVQESLQPPEEKKEGKL